MGIHTGFDDCPKCGGDATTVTNTSGRYQLVCHDEKCSYVIHNTQGVRSTEDWKHFAEGVGIIDEDEEVA